MQGSRHGSAQHMHSEANKMNLLTTTEAVGSTSPPSTSGLCHSSELCFIH